MNVLKHDIIDALIEMKNKTSFGDSYLICNDKYETTELGKICQNQLKNNILTARCAYFNDRKSNLMIHLVQQIVENTKFYPISENYITHISDMGSQFDVLFVCSNDPRRAAKFFRSYRPVLKRKINVVVMAKSTPSDRALLLAAGYDDVFDLKTDVREIRLRVLSYYRRRRNADPLSTPQQLLANGSIESGMLKAKLTPTESVVFSRLIEARQRPVPLTVLCNSVPRAHSRIRMTSARVMLSRLRKKLGPGLAIICQGCSGYALVQTDGLQSRWVKK